MTEKAPSPVESTVGAALNGDLPLTKDERRAYIRFHTLRNRCNAQESRTLEVKTLRSPAAPLPAAPGSTPSRVGMLQFFEWAAGELAPSFQGREVTILDIGCGTGRCLDPFIKRGYRGVYIGLDIARHPKWADGPQGSFERRLVIGDAHTISPDLFPPIDILMSATALEHLRDDRTVCERLALRLAPGAAQVHFVPAAAALRLYGPHGWRQYSAGELARLVPSGTLYRFGGATTNALHWACITRPTEQKRATFSARRPSVYQRIRDLACRIDRMTGNFPPSMYGVLSMPAIPRRPAESVVVRQGDRLTMFRAAADNPRHWDEVWRIDPPRIMDGKTVQRRLRGPFLEFLPRDGVTLEAGCGNGNILRTISNLGFTVEGLDFAPGVIEANRAVHPGGVYRVGDVRRLPYEPNSLGAYISLGVVEHFTERDRGAILDECFRCLRPGGVALIATPFFSPLKRLRSRVGGYRAPTNGLAFYQHYFTADDLRDQVAAAGLLPVAVHTYDGYKGLKDTLPVKPALDWLRGRARAIDRFIDHPPDLIRDQLAHMVMVVARKPGLGRPSPSRSRS